MKAAIARGRPPGDVDWTARAVPASPAQAPPTPQALRHRLAGKAHPTAFIRFCREGSFQIS